MKIAFPIEKFNAKNPLGSALAEHFGRCESFLLIDESGNFLKNIPNAGSHHGGPKTPPEIISENKADILICKGLGLKALVKFNQFGIGVFIAKSDSAKESFGLWKNNRLPQASAQNSCHEHD